MNGTVLLWGKPDISKVAEQDVPSELTFRNQVSILGYFIL